MRKTLLIFVLVLCFGSGYAQFNISGEFRTRGEYRDGYLSLRDSSKTPYLDFLGRARIALAYKHDKFTTCFSLQQAFTYGQDNYSSDTITKNTINVFEAWFKYHFTKTLGIKLGRTQVVYDDERLLGASNWNMWGATHDIIILQWDQGNKGRSDFGLAVNNLAPASAFLNSYNLRNNYKYLTYLYLNKRFFNDQMNVSATAILDAFQKSGISKTTIKNDTQYIYNAFDSIIGYYPVITKTTSLQEFPGILYARATLGAGISFQSKKWNFFLNGYYQFGHYRDGRQLSSWFYSAWVSYQLLKPLKLTIAYDHLSGNNFSDTTQLKTRVHGFSTLYGTSHSFYGYMDLFNSVVKDNLSMGLNDLYAKLSIDLSSTLSLSGTYHWFSIPHPYLPVNNPQKGALPYQEVNKNLGSEVDVVGTYTPFPNLDLTAAYCFFLPTSTMEKYDKLKPGTSKFAQFCYIMITYKPNFYSSDKK